MMSAPHVTQAFSRYAERCPHRMMLAVERRPGNALNVEVGTPAPRCKLKPPTDWPEDGPSVTRWLLSGGSALVLGPCSRSCPLQPKHCDECGHRGENHDEDGCLVGGRVGGCACSRRGSSS